MTGPRSRMSGKRRRGHRVGLTACWLLTINSVLVAPARAQEVPATLTLREAVELAARENPSVRVAALQTAEAKSQVAVAKSATLPHLSFQAASGYQTSNLEGMGLSIPGLAGRLGPFQQFDTRLTIAHNVFAPAIRGRVRVATQAADEQRWREHTERQGIALAVIEGYLQVQEVDARLESASARLRTAAALLEEARRFVVAGSASQLDESRAVIRHEMERTLVTALVAERAISKMRLLKLLGLSPDAPVDLVDRLAPPPPAAIAAADVRAPFDLRPELKAAQAQLRAAAAERQRAVAERLPTIAVIADFGLFGRSLGSNLSTYSVRAMVSMPVYEGGRIEAGIRSAALRTRQAEEAVRDARLQIETDIQVAEAEMAAAVEAYGAAAAAVAAGRTALELAQARFRERLSTNIEVVAAQEALAGAEALEVGRRYAFHVASARLARARGDVMTVLNP